MMPSDMPLEDMLTQQGKAMLINVLSPASGSGKFSVLATDIPADLHVLGDAVRIVPRNIPKADIPQPTLFDMEGEADET